MEIFQDDDAVYRTWLSAHRRGYVVNTSKPPGARYLILHGASCHTITGEPSRGSTWTGGEYAKVCSETRKELEDWAQASFAESLTPCGSCFR